VSDANRAMQTARFLLEVDGIRLGYFSECSGLGMTVQTEQIEEGGNNQYVHVVPGRMMWNNIVLRHGVLTSEPFLRWVSTVSGDSYAGAGNTFERKSGAVTALDERGSRIVSWSFAEGIPVRWGGPSFSASGNEMVAEEVEIAHHGLTFETF
jgi:phage tail-like protein